MFDMGFTEMMLIGIVALIVIGPERLPGVARTAGKYFGRLKRFMTTVRADVEQELRADELRQILAQQQKELDSIKDSISDAGKEVGEQVEAAGKARNEFIAGLEEDPAAPAEAPAGDAPAAADASETGEEKPAAAGESDGGSGNQASAANTRS
jgi:sec-independent protein translocase protein TatB